MKVVYRKRITNTLPSPALLHESITCAFRHPYSSLQMNEESAPSRSRYCTATVSKRPLHSSATLCKPQDIVEKSDSSNKSPCPYSTKTHSKSVTSPVTIGGSMRLSTFKSGMAGAGSMRFIAFNLFLAALLVSIGAIFGVIFTRHQASAQTAPALKITESIRLTSAQGVKSLGQLISEQSSIVIPPKAIASFHFMVDPFSNSLQFPGVEGYQPPGFSWAILPAQDKKFNIPEIPLLAQDALNFYFVQTSGSCNFIVVIEFYP